MPELAKAYVQIIPTTQGIQGELENLLGGEASAAGESAGGKFSSKFGAALKTTGAVAAAGFGIAAGAAGALVKQVSGVAAYGDNIDKMSQKLGMSAEAYQEWAAVMEHSGTSIDAMQSSMKTLANAVENGNEAFERLGISQEQLAGMNNEEIFAATITALQNVDNETERTYLAGQLLGRGATELGALLNTSAEETQAMRDRVHELGGVMSDEAVKNAAAFQDTLQDLKTSIGGVSRGLLTTFLPSVTQIMDGLTTLFSGGDGIQMIKDGVDSFIENLTANTPQFVSSVVDIVIALSTAVAENAPSIITAMVDALITNLPQLLRAGGQIVISLISGIIQSLPQLLLEAGKLILIVLEAVGEGVGQLLDAGANLVRGLWEGIKGAAAWLWQQISGWLGGLWDDIKGFFGIASPSRQMAWAGEMLVEGLARGIDDSADDAVDAATRMNAGILSAMSGGEYDMSATGSAGVEIRHTGTIRVEGVNSAGELVAVTDILYDTIVERLRREARYA